MFVTFNRTTIVLSMLKPAHVGNTFKIPRANTADLGPVPGPIRNHLINDIFINNKVTT